MRSVKLAGASVEGNAMETMATAESRRLNLTDAIPWQGPTRRERRQVALTYLLADLAMLVVAAASAIAMGPATGSGVQWLAGYVLLTALVLGLRGMYRFGLQTSLLDDIGNVVACTSIAVTVLIAARVMLDPGSVDPGGAVILWALATAYVGAARTGLALSARRACIQGQAGLRTVIVGAGVVGRLVARRLNAHPELGLRPIGFLDKDPLPAGDGDEQGRVPVLGASWDLEGVVERHGIDHVILAFSTAPHHVLLNLVRRCRRLGVEVSFVPRLFEEVTRRVSVEHVGGIPLMRVHRVDPDGWHFEIKYALDRVLAAVALLVLAPVLIVLAIMVRASSPGPILYRQPRIGLDGHEFDILKFRTMVGRGEDESRLAESRERSAALREALEGHEPTGLVAPGGEFPPNWATGVTNGSTPNGHPASRVTGVGRLLRATSLDELPQLFNVLRGDMSLVGPRPERPAYAQAFEQSLYRYTDRHRVKSGITGWAQIHGLRGQTSLTDRIEWDNYYIENWSLRLDVSIMLRTLPALFARSDASS